MSSKSAVSEFFCNDLSGSQRVRMDAEQCGWHILLLEAAWRGNPPCSLPDDDHYLQRLVGAEPPKLLSVNPESLSKHVCDVYRSKVNQLMTAMGVSQDCSKSVFAILETMMLDTVRSATDEQVRKLQSLSDENHRRRWQEVSNCFVKRNGLLVDPRLKEEYDKQEYRRQQKAAAGVKGNAEMRKRYYLQPSDDLTEFSDLPNQHPQDDQTASRQRPGLSNSSSTSSSAYISPSLVKGTQKKATRCPLDFRPSKEVEDFCFLECPDLDFEHELNKFIDYWTGVTGKAGFKLDWNATLRNSLREHQKRADEFLKSLL